MIEIWGSPAASGDPGLMEKLFSILYIPLSDGRRRDSPMVGGLVLQESQFQLAWIPQTILSPPGLPTCSHGILRTLLSTPFKVQGVVFPYCASSSNLLPPLCPGVFPQQIYKMTSLEALQFNKNILCLFCAFPNRFPPPPRHTHLCVPLDSPGWATGCPLGSQVLQRDALEWELLGRRRTQSKAGLEEARQGSQPA